jgi:hypothetical protein
MLASTSSVPSGREEGKWLVARAWLSISASTRSFLYQQLLEYEMATIIIETVCARLASCALCCRGPPPAFLLQLLNRAASSPSALLGAGRRLSLRVCFTMLSASFSAYEKPPRGTRCDLATPFVPCRP